MHCNTFHGRFLLLLIASSTTLMGANPFALYPDDNDGDAMVCAKLQESGIKHPQHFWQQSVARQVAEAQDHVDNAALLGLVTVVKDNVLSSYINPNELANIVKQELDSLESGYLADITENHPAPITKVIPAQPQTLTRNHNRRLRRTLCRIHKSLDNHPPKNWRHAFQSGIFKLEDEITSECAVCFDNPSVLYQNICPCNSSIPMCSKCIKKLTIKSIIGKCELSQISDTGPIHIDFALQMPRCPFCKNSYYSEETLDQLDGILPLALRKKIVINSIKKTLEAIAPEKIADFLDRLIASNIPYAKIETRNGSGNIVPLRFIAVQIFERTAAMRDDIHEPFSNASVWKR